MRSRRQQQIVAGLVLIVLGLGLYVLERFDMVGRSAVLFVVGAAFLAGYFHRQEFGFLIPGCLLLGLGAGSVGQQGFFAHTQATLLGLGCGFIGITAIGLVYERRFRWWPLIPGTVLVMLGMGWDDVIHFFARNWPLVLVIAGFLLLIGAFTRSSASRTDG